MPKRTLLSTLSLLLFPLLMTLLVLGLIEAADWTSHTFFDVKAGRFDILINNAIILAVWGGTTLFFIRFSIFLGGLFNTDEVSYASKLIADIYAIMIWFFSILGLFVIVYDESIAGLITASSVTIAIIGFAIRTIVLDFISGIAMGLEKPFHIGDWIEYENTIGAIEQINWRVTRIVTRDGIQVIIPNSHLASIPFHNYNMPRKHFRVAIELIVDYNIDVKRVEHLLLTAANKVEALANAPKKPDTKIREFMPDGVHWQLRFWIDDYAKKDNLTYEVQTNILNNLKFSGITMLGEKQTVFLRKNPVERDRENSVKALLKNINLFTSLPDEDIDTLAKNLQVLTFVAGETVIRQGDRGDSMYVVAEGLLAVSIEDSGETIEVAKIAPGDFFGEMSLLLNEPRSASIVAASEAVIYELHREPLAEIFTHNPTCLDHLSEVLTARRLHNANIVTQHVLRHEQDTKNQAENSILLKLKSLFSV